MDYSKINIHVLRTYAKEIGVKSPSVYTKSVLIEKIKGVESGKIKPFFSKRGRPTSENFCLTQNNKNIAEKNNLLLIVHDIKNLIEDLEKQLPKK